MERGFTQSNHNFGSFGQIKALHEKSESKTTEKENLKTPRIMTDARRSLI